MTVDYVKLTNHYNHPMAGLLKIYLVTVDCVQLSNQYNQPMAGLLKCFVMVLFEFTIQIVMDFG